MNPCSVTIAGYDTAGQVRHDVSKTGIPNVHHDLKQTVLGIAKSQQGLKAGLSVAKELETFFALVDLLSLADRRNDTHHALRHVVIYWQLWEIDIGEESIKLLEDVVGPSFDLIILAILDAL